MDHEFLGKIELDFTKADGDVYDTIIFAGENGSGKTSVLQALTAVTDVDFHSDIRTPYSARPFSAEIEFDGAIMDFSVNHINSDAFDGRGFNEVTLVNDEGVAIEEPEPDGEGVMMYPFGIQCLQMIFSNAEINFTHSERVTPTSFDRDTTSRIGTIESSVDLADEISQLFVDITAKDSYDIADYVRSHPHKVVPDNFVDIRMSRYKRAFEYMFNENLNFHKIGDVSQGRKKIFFIKNGTEEVELNALSSGEKQVVYRSAFLIRDNRATLGCPVLFDEPEISMHPKWQEKVYGFVKQLFTENGIQNSQIFMATHSDHVIKSALQDKSALILRLKVDESNAFSAEAIHNNVQDAILPSLTVGELKWRIFNIPTIDFHCGLYSYIQNTLVNNENGKMISDPSAGKSASVKNTDDFFIRHGNKHKKSNYKKTEYEGITTYIRNSIHHPNTTGTKKYSEPDLHYSIQFMIGIIKSKEP